jgi:polyhydroxybutyrate depolymerase
VSAPDGAKKNSAPLVFAWHGHGGSMQQAARSFRIHEEWPESIVIYPQGLNTPGKLTDPEGKKPGWQHGAGVQGDRDLKFFDAMFAKAKETYKVDTNRVYSTGHSNGGGFTYLLWETRPEIFAAFAPSGAATISAAKLKPKPVLHIMGDNDPLVKPQWQTMTIEAVRKGNGCDGSGAPWEKLGTQYASKGGTPVITFIQSGGHKYPAEAPALIVKFFKQHPAEN